jgi:hypothetical protein
MPRSKEANTKHNPTLEDILQLGCTTLTKQQLKKKITELSQRQAEPQTNYYERFNSFELS